MADLSTAALHAAAPGIGARGVDAPGVDAHGAGSSHEGAADRGPEQAAGSDDGAAVPEATGLRPASLLVALGAVVGAALLGLSVGPVAIRPDRVALELLDHLPGIGTRSGLSPAEASIVWDIRTPRVVLGLLVGALLAGSGTAYQGVFRNQLADPYLLGIGAGAGLGATIAIATGLGDGVGWVDPVPLAAFLGALLAVAAASALSAPRGRAASPATLVLGGIAVTAFLTALQTFVQQRNQESLREVYSFILGRLTTTGWGEVALVLPYLGLCAVVLHLGAGALDVLALGDDEATSLGLRPRRVRTAVLLAASLAAAAAVAVSGLIGFVGLVVPHCVRLVVGPAHRRVVPLSMLFGGAFLAVADVAARSLDAPAELPIGVLTAFVGAPFFLFLLRRQATA